MNADAYKPELVVCVLKIDRSNRMECTPEGSEIWLSEMRTLCTLVIVSD